MLVSVGVNHKKTSLSTLDALTVRDTTSFYKKLNENPDVRESIILQTCNRVDIFLDLKHNISNEKILEGWALETEFKLKELSRLAEVRTGRAVVDYVVRLASGFESMIVGEPQILGQMKEAAIAAQKHGASGPVLTKLFDGATGAGARIRAETGIGRGVTTIGSAAVKLAMQVLGKQENLQVLLLGTGQVGVLVMKALKARDVKNVKVAGRDKEKTEKFCQRFGGAPIDIHSVKENVDSSDLIVVATRSSSFIVDKDTLVNRKIGLQRKLMILDLSNPRNVAPEVAELDGVSVHTLDHLKAIAKEGLESRKIMVKKAEPLVQNEVAKISAGFRRDDAEPIISDVYHRAEEIRAEELERALNKLNLTSEQEKVLDYMSQRIVKKVLNKPVTSIRRAAEKGDARVLTAAGQLFTGE